MAIFEKLDTPLNAVITVDAQTDTIGFYTMDSGDRDSIQYNLAGCKAKVLNDDFFAKFGEILKGFREKCSEIPMQKVALVLPDHLFLMDTIKVPMINRKAMQQSLDLAIKNLYNNRTELDINSEILQQNRKHASYALAGVRKDLLNRLKAVCKENNVGVQGVTFAANATANAASVINPKIKGTNCLLLDIKEKYARFTFMVKGKTMGYYYLPFGYSILMKDRVAAEDMLFDHASGDLLVLNAKERARSKQLTVAEEVEIFEEAEEDGISEDEDTMESVTYEETFSGGMKKTARKLPKFMLRPAPQSVEACAYENFRVFVKWALELIASNAEITAAGMPEAVYVNMPESFAYLFDMVNVEQKENNIIFAPMLTKESAGERIARHMELFGGFYINQYNKNCTF